MSEFDSKKELFDDDPIIFDLADISISSAEPLKTQPADLKVLDLAEIVEAEIDQPEKEVSPVFRELANVELPELEKENRARLQMQTPNRLFFYWSMKDNPFLTLRRAFGDPGNYTLVAKLIDLTRATEAIYPIEAEGTWWFSVDSNREYRVEVGFFAPNRPFVRAMFSNTVATPRKRPSPRAATSADWRLNANAFAKVLDVSGFRRDAVEVALAGDKPQEIQLETQAAFAKFIDRGDSELAGITSEELRHALLLIASGLSIEHLRYRIDASLFALLEASAAKLNAEKAAAALKEHFGLDVEDSYEEEEASPAVFGASVVNFPRRIKRKRTISGYNPVSSSR